MTHSLPFNFWIDSGYTDDRKNDEEEVSNVDDEDDELQENSGVSAYGISAASGTNAAASKRGLPKLREIMRRQKPDSEVNFCVKLFLDNITHLHKGQRQFEIAKKIVKKLWEKFRNFFFCNFS